LPQKVGKIVKQLMIIKTHIFFTPDIFGSKTYLLHIFELIQQKFSGKTWKNKEILKNAKAIGFEMVED
jgi:hypothetical protein